jgi:hypothetical protein
MKIISIPAKFTIEGVNYLLTGVQATPYICTIKNLQTNEYYTLCGHKLQERLQILKII